MKRIRYAFILSALMVLSAANAHAGSIVLSPESAAVVQKSVTGPVVSGALKFDFSAIPKDAKIDLAELTLTLDIDTTLGQSVSIYLGAATDSWSDGALKTSAIASSDSLFANALIETGLDRKLEINLTELVSLWHSGKLPNNGLIVSVPGNESKQVAMDGLPKASVKLTVFYTN